MDTPEIRPTAAFLSEGWTPKQVRQAVADGRLQRVRKGRLTVPSAREPADEHALRTVAVWQSRTDDHIVSHTSAAVLHGLPVRRAALDLVHLTRWSGTNGKVVDGVHLHRAKVPDDQVVELHGVRVTCLERTIADLARLEPYEWGVVAADAALARSADLPTMADLADEGRRKKNNGRLREVLSFADGRAESAAESISRVSMARAGVPAPELQFEVHRPDGGGWVATCDFAWPALGVVGEVDGKLKYVAEGQRSAADVVMDEKERDLLIVACDYTPTHWGWSLATNHLALGQHLRQVFALRQSARRPGA